MSVIRIVRHTRMSPDEVWRRLTDWERHAGHVPLTRTVVLTPPPTHVGTRFTARTGLGRAGVDDPMEVVRWEPPTSARPGRCRLEKRGRVVLGWVEIEVRPAGAGTRILWLEDLRVRGLPRILDPLTVSAGRLLFGRALTGLLGENPRGAHR
ncbi:SRPBCC family protein [Streptomyces sp. A3M-1-3]|uniref:SRPBCC family protein n=1 Tax=Streptomyces sp. A3M-1-3 TaxID=2962044 RepID=UPI0020B760B4|nr:SRPBCC family protein [Streptomyces sp. A3M-1-3]MCP3820039.1 SRPBCC family protein [Streptomyces sp. A3M-1-3]